MQAAAEEDTHQSAAHSQHRHKAQSGPGQRRHGHGEAGGLHAHEEGDVVAGQRGGDAGQQPGVVQHTHADDLQSEDGGRQGCAEEGGEHARHAAEGGQGQVLLPQAQQRAGAVADAAADLERRALTAGAAAAQVGDDRGDEDQRHQKGGYFFAEVDGLDDGVGARALQPAQPVQQGDDHAAQGQQVQNPRVGQADVGGTVDAQVEQRAHEAAHAAHQCAHRQPFQQGSDVQTVVCDALLYLLHGRAASCNVLFADDYSTIYAGVCQTLSDKLSAGLKNFQFI